jgi:hypothetical protein
MNEKIIDILTGEETIRPFTDAEIKTIKDNLAQRQAEQATKDAARQAVLDKLGLSADEIAALLA